MTSRGRQYKDKLFIGLGGFWLFLWASAGAIQADSKPAQRTVLSNGLVLLHRENPSSLTVGVACLLRLSALWETSATAGWRNLVLETLADLPDASGRPLEERLAEHALQMWGQISADYAEVLLQGTADQLPTLLSAVREILSEACPDAPSLHKRQQEVLREIAQRRELPETIAQDMALEALFRGTPLAWPSVGKSSLAGLKAERLWALRRLHFAPNRAIVAVSGPVAWTEVQLQAQQLLGNLLPRSLLPEPSLQVAQGRSVYLYSPWEGDNAVIMMAAICPPFGHPDFPAAAVLSAVLGSGEGSRLFKVLREKSGLAYNIQAELAPSRLCGLMQIVVVCEPARTQEVFRLIRQELAQLRQSPPTEAEIRRAQAYLTSSFVLGRQRNVESAHYLGLFELLLPGKGAEADLPSLLAQVNAEKVEAATRWLFERNVWVQVGGKPL